MKNSQEYNKQWYLKNKERHLENTKKWNNSNKAYYSEYSKKYNNSLGSGVYVACMGERILYVGQSKALKRRITDHKAIRNTKKHVSNSQLQEHIKRYNNKVEFVILENCDPNKLLEREQYYINLLQPEFN
jgi:excinuclease UvrABC nuclease subunit